MADNASTSDPRGERWEHFHHEADMGVRGYGPTQEKAFEQAALAMTAVISDLEKIRQDEVVEVACEAPEADFLLTDWLNALIYEMAVRKMLFSRFEVALEGERLRGKAWGEPVDVERHQPAVEIKGATYTELAVRQDPETGWLAQCVVDV
ncbi:MAG: archease [Nitrospinaceae bacterium]